MLTYILDIAQACTKIMVDIRESVGVTWALLAAVMFATVYLAWSLCRPRYSYYKIPPFPAPRMFLLGHLHLWTGKDVLATMETFREKAGDVFSMDLAGSLIAVFNGYEAVKEVLVKRYNDAPDRPTFGLFRYINEENHGLIDSVGETWKAQRTSSLLILRAFGMGKNILAEKILKEVSIYTDRLSEFNGEPVDISVLTTTSVSNIICSIMVGKRFDYGDPKFLSLIKNVDYYFSKAPNLGLTETIPFAIFLPGDIFGMKFWANIILEINEKFTKPHIKEAKKTFNPSEDSTNYITAYLQKMEQESAKDKPSKLDEKNMIANIRGLFLAGTETTSTTIYWCVLYCLHHPDVQEKIFEEVFTHVGLDRLPNMNDRPNLRYLEAVIRETQRCACLVPIVTRKVNRDFETGGFTVLKDSTVFINLKSVLHDSKIWGDAENFRPERFLDATGNLVNRDELLSFGLGRRACLGEAMAKMELYLFLSAMFQRFRFEPETPGELPSLKGQFSMIVSKPKPYKVRVVARSPKV